MTQANVTGGSREILALITTDEKRVKNGKATMFVCKDEEEQKKILQEVAFALNADVVRLSNGTYMVVKA